MENKIEEKEQKKESQIQEELKKSQSEELKFEELKEEKKSDKKFYYVYFIKAFYISINIKLSLSEKYSEFNSLEILEQIEKKEQNSYNIILYRFKIYPDKILEKYISIDNFEVELILEDKDKNKYTTKIKINDINHDNYIYILDTIYHTDDWFVEQATLDEVVISHPEEFQIFLNNLKKLNLNKNTVEKEDFVYSTLMNLFYNKNNVIKKYEFSFFISIFMECVNTEYFPKFINVFKPENINGFGNVSKVILNQTMNLLNLLEKKIILIKLEKEKNKEELIYNFYTILFYINIRFNKEKIDEMLNNDKINTYIYKSLVINNEFFLGLILKKEHIIKLIDLLDNLDFIKLNNILYYNNDFLILLQIIKEKKYIFLSKYIEYNKDKKEQKDEETYDIELYILPKKEDDINAIYDIIKELLLIEKESKQYFIKFSNNLIDKYINLFKNEDLDKLFSLNKIINLLKKESKKFMFKKNIEELIHNTAIYLSNKEKLKNIEILNFIDIDIYYKEKRFNNKENRPVNILTGIDVSSLNDDFYKKWKKLNLYKIFENQRDIYINKICSLIKDMKYFNILFKLLNQNIEENNDKKIYDISILTKMQNVFENLMPTYSPEKCPNFIDDIVELIYYCNLINVNLEYFNKECIQKLLNVKTVNELYISLANKYTISDNLIKIIIDFFLKNPLNNNIENLIYILKNSVNLRKDLLSNMRKYIITEEDIFQIEESNNFKLLKELIKEDIFNINDNKLMSTDYIKQSINKKNEIIKKINTLDIEYSILNIFFENKVEMILYEKLCIILKIGESDINKVEGQAMEYKEMLYKNYSIIKNSIKDLEYILYFLNYLYKRKYSDDITEINRIIHKIKNGKVISYLNEYEQKYSEYSGKFILVSQRNEYLLKSNFFATIYKETRSKYKNDDECFNKASEKLKQLKLIFLEKLNTPLGEYIVIDEIKSNSILEVCLRNFNRQNIRQELDTEVNILIKIFDIRNKIDKNRVIENLILLSKRNDILNLTNGIKLFIDRTGAEKTDFYKMINNIIINVQSNDEIAIIKNSIDELEKTNIYNFKEKTSYFDVLTKFREQPEALNFLFNTTLEDCRKFEELSLENNDEFLNQNDILDLEKCITFFKKLGTKEEYKFETDKDLIMKLKDLINNNSIISVYIEKYINNYGQLKEFINSGLDASEISKKKIDLIFEKSEFILTNEKGKFFNCNYYEKNIKNEEELIKKNLNMDNLLELRDRAQLAKVVSGDKKDKEIIKKNKIFIQKVSEINNIYKIVQEIYSKGYPKIITIKIEINGGKSDFKIENEKNKNYQEVISDLKNILYKLKDTQINAYKNKPLIRYLFGRQFNLLYNSIINIKEENAIKQIYPFLQYFTNNLITRNLENFNFQKIENPFDELIINCENYLNELLLINNLTLKNVYQESIIVKKYKNEEYKGVYIYLCEKLEKKLYQIFKYLTSNSPLAQNTLLCNEDTSNEEISSFLYRAIFCEFNACFIVGGIESLKSDQKSTIIEVLKQNESFLDKNKMKSCLIFLYTNKSTDIYKSLDLLKYKKILYFDDTKTVDNLKFEGTEVQIIYSDKCSVGKSYKIRNDIFSKNKVYIHFPYGGVLSRDETIERLKKLKIDIYSEIHLDLYDSDKINLMMEFLFSILITKLYKNNENMFYISKNINIKIEIPNSFIDFFAKFPILDLFPKIKLSINNLVPVIMSKIITSEDQIVSNYLKAFKENRLDNEDLFFPMLTPQLDEKKIKKYTKKKEYKLTPAEILNDNECNKLIIDAIKDYDIKNPNYHQIKTFIKILGMQLKNFSRNSYLTALNLLSLKDKDFLNIRSFIIKVFINITKYFIQGAFDDLLQNQIITHEMLFGQYDERKDIKNAIDNLAKNKNGVFSFENINTPLLFFYENNKDYFKIFRYTSIKDSDSMKLAKLFENFKKEKNLEEKPKKDKKNKDIKETRQMFYLKELKDLFELENPVQKEIISQEKEKDKKDKGKKHKDSKEDINNANLKSLEEITQDYVFTSDNFLKMIFIIMRINAGIPVIMMGETGCGKTALIRKLSQIMNNGQNDKLKKLNIHAGTTDQDIIDFLEKEVINEAIELNKEETKKKVDKFKEGKIYSEKKIWVFLDEINTCKSMGLISELMCKNSYHGKALPTNIIFIGACNPYRKTYIKNEEIGLNIYLAHQEKNNLNDNEKEIIRRSTIVNKGKLVYNVNPFPHSLLNFVFDFGNLSPENEKKYIENIINDPIEKECIKNNFIGYSLYELKKFATNLIVICQNFIRDNNDKSSVSLREIRRFNIFFSFFCRYYSFKIKNIEKLEGNFEFEKDYKFLKEMNEFDIIKYSIYLSIYICYYVRITDKKLRKELLNKINDVKLGLDNKYYSFLYISKFEQEFLIKNINLEKGISKNRALLENIFSLFVAINNKVPIFIVGKPGCSKSLSVQLINKAMKGSTSSNFLFQSLPKLIINSYQGSMSSTSKGVKNIFLKARNVIKNLKPEDRNKNISMIFFDEMGLAEHSPNNPLKVIHGELEYDLNEGEHKIAFVGISNWSLDASKMNRGIFISIPEPDESDTKKTALTIGSSFNKILAEKNKNYFENLGKIYYNYKKYLKEKHSLDGKEDFHGNRDFYHLVKNCAQNMSLKYKDADITEKDLIEFGLKSIERNFAGIQFEDINNISSVEVVKKYFKEIYQNCIIEKEYNVIERVKENINDLNSRYLLVASKSSVSSYLLSSILSDLKKDYCFYIGSKFEKDLKSEEYILKVLNKVQIYMEQDKILIMENLNSVYPAMYDLFNQNFTVVSNKKYARLAIGSTTNTYSLVNKDFRCIINVKTNELEKQEAPFLNRFEKQIISFDYLLTQDLMNESNKIIKILNELVKKKPMYKAINYDLEKLLINCDIDEIRAILFDAIKREISKDKLLDEVLSKISLTLPQDIILFLKYNGFIQKNRNIYKKIMDFYKKGEHFNITNFIKTMKNNKNVIYTFTSDLESINIPDMVNPMLGNINKKNIKIKKLSSIDSESILESFIDDFINDDENKLCIIQFRPDEGSLMNYIKFFIENKEKEYLARIKEKKDYRKAFIFIIHIKRIFNKDIKDLEKKKEEEKKEFNKKILNETLSNLSGYNQIFVDNLNGSEELSLDNILQMKANELFNKCLNIDEELSKNIFNSLLYMKYNINSSIGSLNKESYINNLIAKIDKDISLRKTINDCVLDQLSKESDILGQIFKNQNSITENDIDFINVIKNYISSLYLKKLTVLFFKLEKDHYISSLLSYEEMYNLDKNKKIDNIEDITSIIYQNKNEDRVIEEKEINDIIKNLIQKTSNIYISKLNLNQMNIRITEGIGANNVNIVLGLNLPGIKPILEKLIKKVKDEVVNKYYQNEIGLRGCQSKGNDLIKDIENYYNELKRYNNTTLIEIEKEEFFNLLENEFNGNPIEINIFYYLLLNDYYTLYINNNLNKSNNNNLRENANQNQINEDEENVEKVFDFESTKKFLKLLVSLKNKYSKYDQLTQIEILANTINWLETYETEITIILKMFSKLNSIIPSSFDIIDKNINSGRFKYGISKKNPEFTSIVNEVFFIGMESILNVITLRMFVILHITEDKITQMINVNKEILQDAMQINTNLNLFSTEIYSLQELVDLVDAFNLNNKITIRNIKVLICFINRESILILKNRIEDLCGNLKQLYEFITKILKKSQNYNKIMNKVLYNEFQKINEDNYRIEILNIIFKDNKLIINSTQILKIIIKNYISSNPTKDLTDNIKTLCDNKNLVLNLLNTISEKNIFLEEILLSIFESQIIYYFDSIPLIKDKEEKKKFQIFFNDNKNFKEVRNFRGIIFDKSFEYFKILYNHLELIIDKEENKVHNSNLLKLYAIAYVKIYLKYFVDFIKEKKDIEKFKPIIEFFSITYKFEEKKNNLKKVIKIYILKLINNLIDNFEEFKKFDFEKCGINFHKEFSLWQSHQNSKIEDIVNYCLLTLDNEKDRNNFFDELLIFNLEKKDKFKNEKNLLNKINSYGLDTFVCIAINKISQNLIKIKDEDVDNFSKLNEKLFSENNYKCNLNLKELLSLIFNKGKFDSIIRPYILKKGKISSKLFEILLYSFRFCVQSLEALEIQKKNKQQKKLLFASILSLNCSNNLDSYFIPGNEIYEDLHLTTLEFIENHLNSSPDNIGCYVCSCGYYYSIQPCGFPNQSSICPVCKLGIGKGNKKISVGIHGLERRPGHYRIFKDENQHQTCMNRYKDSDENVPNMTLENYKNTIINPLLNKAQKGLTQIPKEQFIRKNKVIRKLSELSYRILNYIIYSHLFFANCLKFIDGNKLKNYLVLNMTCIEIIEQDWDFIKEILQQKGIQSIEIFMNLIFKRLSDLIKNCDCFTTENLRNSFEQKINDLITKCLNEYSNYRNIYIEENQKLLNLSNDDIQTIINELVLPNEYIYNEKDYPLFKYFILTKYSSKSEFIKKLGPSNIYALKYPLLYQYLLDNIDTKKMKYLPAFNEFTNYMVENYSFKISRDDAKKRILKNEQIFSENGFAPKYKNFINAWNQIKSEAIKYKCRPEMIPKDLKQEDNLVYFLNDDGELGYGMYLAAACQNFITWQNSFLQPIIDNIAQNGILHHFANNMQRKIPVQSAKINQTLLIEDCFNNSLYYNFEDIISTFCRRDIFQEDGTINYSNYNSFIYDFGSIEEELGKLLLPGKCLFENEDNLNFITYWSEGFRGGKSDTLINFYLKYPQKDLTEYEIMIIFEYIQLEKNKDFKPFFGSMQLIIFYLTNNLYKNDEKIIDILNKAPKYLKISDICINFFSKEGKDFKVEKLMNVFFFIEHLCFEDLSNTLQPEYKKEIPKELQDKIKHKLLEQKNDNVLSVKELAAALRRYISRYLAGKRESVDINETRELYYDLTRIDLWKEKIGRLDNLEELVYAKIGEFKLNVGQAFNLYKLIEVEDINPINQINKFKDSILEKS